MRSLFFISALLVSSAVYAQEATDPMANFPTDAVTQVQQPTGADVPASPENPANPAVPGSPKSPEQPIGEVSEKWPADTVKVFVIGCTHGNLQLITPCRCTIENLMQSMTHREFMEISQKSAMDKDVRYTAARQQCALKTQATRKKK